MGQWAVSVLGLDPLHLEVTPALRVRVCPGITRRPRGRRTALPRTGPAPHRRRIPCPANSPEAPGANGASADLSTGRRNRVPANLPDQDPLCRRAGQKEAAITEHARRRGEEHAGPAGRQG